MRPGSHCSEEFRAKLSAANKGKSPPNKGKPMTAEQKAKISAANKGEVRVKGIPRTAEVRAKISAAHKGIPVSAEARAKISATKWKGGVLASVRRTKAKRRALGFVPLNEPFDGCEGHHVDKECVIYLPKVLHCSVRHRQTDGRGMAKINAVAFNFLFKQEVETVMAGRNSDDR